MLTFFIICLISIHTCSIQNCTEFKKKQWSWVHG